MKRKPLALLQIIFAITIMLLTATDAFAASASGVNWETSIITVTGNGIAPPNAVNVVQGRMLARRAAVVDGYRQLAEIVKGVNVDSESTVENFMVISDTTTTKVNAVIQGATIVSERDIPGGYEVTMSIPMFGVSGSLAGAVMPKQEKREPFPMPVQSVAPSLPVYDIADSVKVRIEVTGTKEALPASDKKAIGGYTGLIVDCRGLGLKPVMSPIIKNTDGEAIYGHKNLDPDYIIDHGMAAYTTNPDSGADRAGSNPLVIKAVSLDNHNGNAVLSVADANRVLIENQNDGFLEKTKVVFVR